jgi:hypothetical protein
VVQCSKITTSIGQAEDGSANYAWLTNTYRARSAIS